MAERPRNEANYEIEPSARSQGATVFDPEFGPPVHLHRRKQPPSVWSEFFGPPILKDDNFVKGWLEDQGKAKGVIRETAPDSCPETANPYGDKEPLQNQPSQTLSNIGGASSPLRDESKTQFAASQHQQQHSVPYGATPQQKPLHPVLPEPQQQRSQQMRQLTPQQLQQMQMMAQQSPYYAQQLQMYYAMQRQQQMYAQMQAQGKMPPGAAGSQPAPQPGPAPQQPTQPQQPKADSDTTGQCEQSNSSQIHERQRRQQEETQPQPRFQRKQSDAAYHPIKAFQKTLVTQPSSGPPLHS